MREDWTDVFKQPNPPQELLKYMKILFRIPFTLYFVALTNSVQINSAEIDTRKQYFCLATKKWDSKGNFYYFKVVN